MGRNPDYFAQIRARGVCSLCLRPMRDDDPRLAHPQCSRLQSQGWRVAEIRAQQWLPFEPEEAPCERV